MQVGAEAIGLYRCHRIVGGAAIAILIAVAANILIAQDKPSTPPKQTSSQNASSKAQKKSLSQEADQEPSPDYQGYFRSESNDVFHIGLHLIEKSRNDKVIFYRALLSLSSQPGKTAFTIQEYFEDVVFHKKRHWIRFKKYPEHNVVIDGNLERRRISGFMYLIKDDIKGNFELLDASYKKLSQQMAKIDFSPDVIGRYSGQCDDKNYAFNILGLRRPGTIMSTIESVELLAIPTEKNCHDCVIHAESFSRIVRDGKIGANIVNAKGEECEFAEGTLKCDDCSFKRKPWPEIQFADVNPKLLETDLLKITDKRQSPQFKMSEQSGKYFGYLRNAYSGKINLVTFDVAVGEQKGKVIVDGLFNIFYGPYEKNLFTVYKFKGIQYVKGQLNLIFDGEGSDVFLKVLAWEQHFIKAMAYSKQKGIIGPMELAVEGLPPLEGFALQEVSETLERGGGVVIDKMQFNSRSQDSLSHYYGLKGTARLITGDKPQAVEIYFDGFSDHYVILKDSVFLGMSLQNSSEIILFR